MSSGVKSVSPSGRYFYPEEFDQPAVPVRAVIALATLGVAAVCLGSMYLGAWMQAQVTPEPDVRFVQMACPKPALTQWTCDGRERAEYLEACRRRAASSLTKSKER